MVDDGVYHLAYRVRRPVEDGRGFAVTVARSVDGLKFEPGPRSPAYSFGAASLERPALVRRPDGGWRIYISCATPGTCHWWIDALEADAPEEFDATVARPSGRATTPRRWDPVVVPGAEGWEAWVCCHPLTERGDGTGWCRDERSATTGCDGPGRESSSPAPPVTGTSAVARV